MDPFDLKIRYHLSVLKSDAGDKTRTLCLKKDSKESRRVVVIAEIEELICLDGFCCDSADCADDSDNDVFTRMRKSEAVPAELRAMHGNGSLDF
jgi:hypothetical protein